MYAFRSDYDEGRKLGRGFFQSTGLQKKVNVLVNGELLTDEELEEDSFEDVSEPNQIVLELELTTFKICNSY